MRFRRQSWIARVTVVSLLLKLAVAALHMPLALAASPGIEPGAHPSASNTTLTQVVICTPTGLHTLTLDGDGNPVDAPSAPSMAPECGLCSVLNVGLNTTLPEASALAAPVQTTASVAKSHDAVCHPEPLRLAHGYDPPIL